MEYSKRESVRNCTLDGLEQIRAGLGFVRHIELFMGTLSVLDSGRWSAKLKLLSD